MKLTSMLQNLTYLGQAEGDKSTYYVYAGSRGYLVFTPRGSDNFGLTLVDHEAPEVIAKKFIGQRVTPGRIRKDAHRPDLFGSQFGPHNALYTMVAARRARKLVKREGRSMVFKILK